MFPLKIVSCHNFCHIFSCANIISAFCSNQADVKKGEYVVAVPLHTLDYTSKLLSDVWAFWDCMVFIYTQTHNIHAQQAHT